jgi:hypothetical protein
MPYPVDEKTGWSGFPEMLSVVDIRFHDDKEGDLAIIDFLGQNAMILNSKTTCSCIFLPDFQENFHL